MRKRVLIENVQPAVDNGRYFIKRVLNESVKVTADIYADGHDTIRASVLYKKASQKKWTEIFMNADGNDAWSANFTVTEKGFYEYKVIAWIDHLSYWYKGFLKKEEAGQHLSVELEEGVLLLTETAANYPKTKAKALLDAAKKLGDKKGYKEAVAAVQEASFGEMIQAFPLKRFISESAPNLKVRVERTKALYSTWYEFFPRSASPDASRWGTFKDCHTILPRVAEMGFDVLYFPPIHPVGKVNRKGRNNSVTAEPGEPGSPWAIGSDEGGHKSVNPELGTMQDYEDLISAAKDQGIEIALDLAFQCAPDHPYVKEHPEWFIWRPDNTIMYAENPPKKYQDIVPLNFECDEWESLWEELKSVIIFWVEKGINIFRVDNPHTKPIPFWEWAIAEVHKKYPDVLFLSEAFTRPKVMAGLAKAGFNQSYSYFTWRINKHELQEYMTELTRTESREYFRPNFWPNTPDILPYHLQGGGPNIFVQRLLLAATLSSNYGMYGMAYEVMDNKGNFNGKEEYLDSEKYEVKHYNWNLRNRVTDAITKVNRIRQEQPALQNTWNIHFTATGNDNLMSYLKIEGDNIIWCIVNLDPHHTQSGFVEVPKQLLGITEGVNLSLHDLLTDQYYQWNNDWNYVELSPDYYSMHILKVKIQ